MKASWWLGIVVAGAVVGPVLVWAGEALVVTVAKSTVTTITESGGETVTNRVEEWRFHTGQPPQWTFDDVAIWPAETAAVTVSNDIAARVRVALERVGDSNHTIVVQMP